MVFLYSFYVLYLIIENVSLAIQCFILIATVFNIISQTILRLCLPAASLYNNKIELFLDWHRSSAFYFMSLLAREWVCVSNSLYSSSTSYSKTYLTRGRRLLRPSWSLIGMVRIWQLRKETGSFELNMIAKIGNCLSEFPVWVLPKTSMILYCKSDVWRI